MKRLNFAVMLMMSLVVISCSKEDQMPPVYERDTIESDTVVSDTIEGDYPVGLQYKQMYLDTCEIKFPFDTIPMGGDNHWYFYQIEIPREGAEFTLTTEDPEFKLGDITLGTFKGIVKEYKDYSWWYYENPFLEGRLEFLDDGWRRWKYDTEIGYFEHKEHFKLECRIPKSEEKGNKVTAISLGDPTTKGCLVVFLQKPEN